MPNNELRSELVEKFQSAEDGLAPQEITELLNIIEREKGAAVSEAFVQIEPYLKKVYKEHPDVGVWLEYIYLIRQSYKLNEEVE